MTLAFRCSNCGTALQTSSANPLYEQIKVLTKALELCAAPFSTSPGTVAQCQTEIGVEFQRRMDIAGEALRSAVGGSSK